MTNEQAWLYAASWGSYVTSGDPGACLYGFNASFQVQSEEHRAECIAQMRENRAYVEANPEHYDEDELEQIDSLLAKLAEAGVGTSE